jgi:hypothetical protein
MARQPVGITTHNGGLIVVCNDGSVFGWVASQMGWEALAPIPETASAEAAARSAKSKSAPETPRPIGLKTQVNSRRGGGRAAGAKGLS